MEKFKVCPSCSKRNSPISLECNICESDLTGIRVLDEDTEKMFSESEDISLPSENEVTRLCCYCDTRNPPNARKCLKCGEDISDIVPDIPAILLKSEIVSDEHVVKSRYTLNSIDGGYVYKIISEFTSIGRDLEIGEYLKSKSFVSRMHANIIIENGSLILENLDNTNSTYVNNKKMDAGERIPLSCGDEVGLGGFIKDGQRQEEAAYFIVRID